MSKQANPTVIGAFVVGAVVLVAVAAAIFGGGELLTKRTVYVAYFEDQTKGLRVGSNVVANGVRVGFVSDIALLVDEETYETMTRVRLEILPDAYIAVRNGVPIREPEMDSMLSHRELIDDAGLRAQLEIESFITGQLLIRLEHRPDTEAIMRGVNTSYPEIPTIPSDIQEILGKIQNWALNLRDTVDIAELTESLNDALRNIADLASSEDLTEAIAGINRMVQDREMRQLATSLNEALADVSQAANEATRVLSSADQNIDTIAAEISPILRNMDTTLDEVNMALQSANRQLRGDTEEVYQIQATLREVEHAAQAMREFFDYLERNPEAFLRGKRE